jgi:hypothetical protein
LLKTSAIISSSSHPSGDARPSRVWDAMAIASLLLILIRGMAVWRIQRWSCMSDCVHQTPLILMWFSLYLSNSNTTISSMLEMGCKHEHRAL